MIAKTFWNNELEIELYGAKVKILLEFSGILIRIKL